MTVPIRLDSDKTGSIYSSNKPNIIDVACYCVLPLNSSNYYTFLVYNYVPFCKIKTEAYFG